MRILRSIHACRKGIEQRPWTPGRNTQDYSGRDAEMAEWLRVTAALIEELNLTLMVAQSIKKTKQNKTYFMYLSTL